MTEHQFEWRGGVCPGCESHHLVVGERLTSLAMEKLYSMWVSCNGARLFGGYGKAG